CLDTWSSLNAMVARLFLKETSTELTPLTAMSVPARLAAHCSVCRPASLRVPICMVFLGMKSGMAGWRHGSKMHIVCILFAVWPLALAVPEVNAGGAVSHSRIYTANASEAT